jgi:hypothetical protein
MKYPFDRQDIADYLTAGSRKKVFWWLKLPNWKWKTNKRKAIRRAFIGLVEASSLATSRRLGQEQFRKRLKEAMDGQPELRC